MYKLLTYQLLITNNLFLYLQGVKVFNIFNVIVCNVMYRIFDKMLLDKIPDYNNIFF